MPAFIACFCFFILFFFFFLLIHLLSDFKSKQDLPQVLSYVPVFSQILTVLLGCKWQHSTPPLAKYTVSTDWYFVGTLLAPFQCSAFKRLDHRFTSLHPTVFLLYINGFSIVPVFCVIFLSMLIHNSFNSKYDGASGLWEQRQLTFVFECVLRETE